MNPESRTSLFNGFHSIDELHSIQNWPGLYSVFCYRDNTRQMMDVGESDNLRSAVKSSIEENLCCEDCKGTLIISVFYSSDMQESERQRIETEVRERSDLR